MKKKLGCLIVACIMSLIECATILAQETSMDYLDKTFPQLTNLYREELKNCHTHYIFAVDVSGSMVKYDSIVTPVLKAFSNALPIGEQVSVIPFGTTAKENTPGLCCKIESDAQKQVLSTALSTLYVNDGYSREFKQNTDVEKAVAAVNKTILNNQNTQMNVVVIITDFLNDLPGVGECKLQEEALKALNKDFENVTKDKYTRVVALQLPPAGSGKGFCLTQLQDNVFQNTTITRRFDIVQAINDRSAISHWFNQLTRDIMTEKLKAVIQLDNERNLQPRMETKIDIDGNTTAEIHWKPNKLYKKIKIEKTTTDPKSDYVFKNNEKAWQTTMDTSIVVDLGKLVHKEWGFRKYNERLNIGMSLPTPYDDELNRLSIDKPIQATSDKQSGWLFTFFLPLWLTLTLLALLILYIIGVMKAMARNRKLCFKGNVTFYDDIGNQLDNRIMIPKQSPSAMLTIGKGGSSRLSLSDADWQFVIEKKKSNPFLVFTKPYFQWRSTRKYVAAGKSRSGKLSYDGSSMVKVKCGESKSQLTHSVKVQLTK